VKLAHAIELATHDYRVVISEPDLTTRQLADAARHDPGLDHHTINDWHTTDHAIDDDTAEAYHELLHATNEQIDAALDAMQGVRT
jgi:hypothetical protein